MPITTHSSAHIGKRAQFGHDTARGVRYGTKAWLALRAWVLKRARHLCAICGKLANTADHIDNDPTNNKASNLQAICPVCHTKKTREQAKK